MLQDGNYRESLEYFRRGPEILDAALAGMIARHLFDTEIVAGMRLRQIIAEDSPLMATFDQDLWANRPGYNDVDSLPAGTLGEWIYRPGTHLEEDAGQIRRAREAWSKR